MSERKKVGPVYLNIVLDCVSEEHAAEVFQKIQSAYKLIQFTDPAPENGWPKIEHGIDQETIEVVEE